MYPFVIQCNNLFRVDNVGSGRPISEPGAHVKLSTFHEYSQIICVLCNCSLVLPRPHPRRRVDSLGPCRRFRDDGQEVETVCLLPRTVLCVWNSSKHLGCIGFGRGGDVNVCTSLGLRDGAETVIHLLAPFHYFPIHDISALRDLPGEQGLIEKRKQIRGSRC